MEQVNLIIEKSKNDLCGRVTYGDDLIIETAKTVSGLERKLKKLLKDFHATDPKTIVFDHQYDVTTLFEKYNYLKISSIAVMADINPGLLRQYASGVKHPSPKQAKKLENAIHQIGKELSLVTVFAE